MGRGDLTGSESAPAWFREALAAPGDSCRVTVAGASIHYLRWGDPTKPGLLIIPGGGGHAHWFSHVAPLLAEQFQVACIDLSGMGDSDRRSEYQFDTMIEEVMGVCEHAGMTNCEVPPILAGHSMGGQFAVRVANAQGHRLLGIIAIDALRQALLDKDPAVARFARDGRLGRTANRVYDDREAAIARFRLQPAPQHPIEADHVLAHIGRHSVHQVEGGWTWKYDPKISSLVVLGLEFKDQLTSLACRSAAIFGEHSHIVDEHTLRRMDEATGGAVPSLIIPGASHYPMIDRPLSFVATLRAICCQWVSDYRRQRKPT